jgi:hypothetical protein
MAADSQSGALRGRLSFVTLLVLFVDVIFQPQLSVYRPLLTLLDQPANSPSPRSVVCPSASVRISQGDHPHLVMCCTFVAVPTRCHGSADSCLLHGSEPLLLLCSARVRPIPCLTRLSLQELAAFMLGHVVYRLIKRADGAFPIHIYTRGFCAVTLTVCFAAAGFPCADWLVCPCVCCLFAAVHLQLHSDHCHLPQVRFERAARLACVQHACPLIISSVCPRVVCGHLSDSCNAWTWA